MTKKGVDKANALELFLAKSARSTAMSMENVVLLAGDSSNDMGNLELVRDGVCRNAIFCANVEKTWTYISSAMSGDQGKTSDLAKANWDKAGSPGSDRIFPAFVFDALHIINDSCP